MKKLSVLGVGLLSVMIGCAHSTMRGTVAMKATDDELHVCMGEKEVKAGDHVAFFFNDCKTRGGRAEKFDICRKVWLGEGEVVKPLNEHYSLVRPNPGVKVQEGTLVEKL